MLHFHFYQILQSPNLVQRLVQAAAQIVTKRMDIKKLAKFVSDHTQYSVPEISCALNELFGD